MVIKVRPGWELMYELMDSNNKAKFVAYVCTAAEREYAQEAWRAVDQH